MNCFKSRSLNPSFVSVWNMHVSKTFMVFSDLGHGLRLRCSVTASPKHFVYKILFLPAVVVSHSTLRFFVLHAQGSCSAPGLLWEMPVANPCPLPSEAWCATNKPCTTSPPMSHQLQGGWKLDQTWFLQQPSTVHYTKTLYNYKQRWCLSKNTKIICLSIFILT